MARRKPKRVAQAIGGYGNVPGYGPVRNPPAQTPSAPKPVAFTPSIAARQDLPPDAGYDQQLGSLAQRRDDTLAGIANAQTRTLADYGYGATFDDKGTLTGLNFDPNNPFSRAALLRKSYQQSKAGTQSSMASRGQLYAGALVAAQSGNDVNYQQGENTLQRSAGDVLSGLADRRRQAQSDYEFESGRALGERVSRASQSPLYQPVSPETTVAPSAAPAAGRPTPKAGFQFVQDSGPNKGLSYKIVKKNGRNFRRFEDGRDVPQ